MAVRGGGHLRLLGGCGGAEEELRQAGEEEERHSGLQRCRHGSAVGAMGGIGEVDEEEEEEERRGRKLLRSPHCPLPHFSALSGARLGWLLVPLNSLNPS